MQIYHVFNQHCCVAQGKILPLGIPQEVQLAHDVCPALVQHGLLEC